MKYVIFCLLSSSITVLGMQEIFSSIYTSNGWRDPDSVSGSGSNLKQTEILRKRLPELLRELGVNYFIDAPCGDFFWMQEVIAASNVRYIGIDIVQELINKNNARYANEQCEFLCADVTVDPLPKADLILCRDCLVHLKFEDGLQAIRNMKQSGIRYLLVTTFTRQTPNKDIPKTSIWRTLNMQLPPYNFPEPLLLINEGCTEKNKDGTYEDKCLGLWLLDDIEI